MNSKKYIIEELNKISPLIKEIDKTEVYSVSPSYFDNLSVDIINNIHLSKEHAYFFGSAAPYSTPDNYFQNLPGLILQKVVANQTKPDAVFEETENIAPLLNRIEKTPVFSVPANYFDRTQLPTVTIQTRQAKIASIRKRSQFLRLAAAAVVIPFLAVGVYTLTSRDFLKNGSNKAKNEVKNLSREEIVNFLKGNDSSEHASSTSQNTSVDDPKLQRSLKQISDKEIQQFLKETGESDEI